MKKGEHSEAKKKKKVFHLFRLVSCCQACQSGGIPYLPVTGIVREQKPQSFYTDVMDGVSSWVQRVNRSARICWERIVLTALEVSVYTVRVNAYCIDILNFKYEKNNRPNTQTHERK